MEPGILRSEHVNKELIFGVSQTDIYCWIIAHTLKVHLNDLLKVMQYGHYCVTGHINPLIFVRVFIYWPWFLSVLER